MITCLRSVSKIRLAQLLSLSLDICKNKKVNLDRIRPEVVTPFPSFFKYNFKQQKIFSIELCGISQKRICNILKLKSVRYTFRCCHCNEIFRRYFAKANPKHARNSEVSFQKRTYIKSQSHTKLSMV